MTDLNTNTDHARASELATRLRAQIRGAVFTPSDAEYADAVAGWNLRIARRPAVVAVPEREADIGAIVREAGRVDMRVTVSSTGHGALSDLANTLLIRTTRLTGVEMVASDRVRIQAGATWQQVLDVTAPLGLAALCGAAPDVGAVGYLTGGGLGPFARTYGLSSDWVRLFEVVTGDGVPRTVSAQSNPELFWALRGSKGSLGIVTAVELEVPSLSSFYGGAVFFAAEDIPRVLHAWAEWCTDLPKNANTSVALLRLPPAPGIPEPVAGTPTLALRYTWVGSAEQGAQIVAPMLATASPVLGEFAERPYREIGLVHADPVDPMPVVESGALLRNLPAGAVNALLSVAGPSTTSPQLSVELRLLGGSVQSDDHSCIRHRHAGFNLFTVAVAASDEARTIAQDHSAKIHEELWHWATGTTQPNFCFDQHPSSTLRTYSEETLDRLERLISVRDPHGVIAEGHRIGEALAWAGRGRPTAQSNDEGAE